MAETADQMLARAMQLHRQGAVIEAINLYNRVLGNSPGNVAALNLLGIAASISGEAQRAVAPLQQALALNPDLPSGRCNLGRILQGLKRYEEARRQYELALARQPDDPEIHNNLGTLLRAIGRHDEAIAHFRGALERKPDYAEAHVNLGNALQVLGRHQDAIAALERAVMLNARVAKHIRAWAMHSRGGRRTRKPSSGSMRPLRCVRAIPLRTLIAATRCTGWNGSPKPWPRTRGRCASIPPMPTPTPDLGAALYELGHYDRAVDQYRKAVAIPSDSRRAGFGDVSGSQWMELPFCVAIRTSL